MTASYYTDREVPYEGPDNASILFVGEAPGENEYLQGRPFIGESGQLFINCLNRNGIMREEVKLANLSKYRPNGNKFELLIGTEALRSGLRELYQFIQDQRPTVICAMGAFPLMFLTGRKGIKKWRGSILSYINDDTIKVIPTFHPAFVLRDRGAYPTFDLDIKRVVGDSLYPERRLPVRRFVIDPRGLDCEEWTERLCDAEFLGTDIETVKNSRRILCVGFAPSPDVAVCFVPSHAEGERAIRRVLGSDVDKILQFGTYDTIQLIHNNGYEWNPGRKARALGRPYYWDTFIAQHILAPELPRSLEYLTSIHTREPYYKTVGRGTIPDDEKGWSEKVDKQTLYEYNCRDDTCTIEVAIKQMAEIGAESLDTQDMFQFEMESIEVACHISNSGMLQDEERRLQIESVLLDKWAKKQFVLNRMTGFETNVRSPKLKDILYGHMGLPVRKKQVKGKSTITTDEDAIVSLITFCKDHLDGLVRADAIMDWKIKLAVCQTILEIRGIRQVLSNYILKTNKKGIPRAGPDGRIRSTFKVGGTGPGRWSATRYVDGTGFNMQTLPRDPVEVPVDEPLTSAPQLAILVSQLVEEPDEAEDETEQEADAAD